MTVCRENRGFAANLLLALLLIVAQTSALAHAYEHDVGKSPSQACTDCVTATQLASACVDNPATVVLPLFNSPLHQLAVGYSISINAIVARQRGPPVTL